MKTEKTFNRYALILLILIILSFILSACHKSSEDRTVQYRLLVEEPGYKIVYAFDRVRQYACCAEIYDTTMTKRIGDSCTLEVTATTSFDDDLVFTMQILIDGVVVSERSVNSIDEENRFEITLKHIAQ